MKKPRVMTLPDLAEIVRKRIGDAKIKVGIVKEGVYTVRKEKLSLHRTMQMLELLFREIALDLADGHRIEIRGLGVFDTVRVKERIWRQPMTGEIIHTRSSIKARFRTSKLIRRKWNE